VIGSLKAWKVGSWEAFVEAFKLLRFSAFDGLTKGGEYGIYVYNIVD
jgi:hypothetical protein